jgi:hypothetical protein
LRRPKQVSRPNRGTPLRYFEPEGRPLARHRLDADPENFTAFERRLVMTCTVRSTTLAKKSVWPSFPLGAIVTCETGISLPLDVR